MGQATDAELWRRAVQGEPDAFGILFERHSRVVYNYLFRRTADWALAEDLTSVVFLEAWRKRENVRPEGELALPWLLGVATNVLRNRRRSQWRHRAALQRIPPERGSDFADDADAVSTTNGACGRFCARSGRFPSESRTSSPSVSGPS